MTLDLNETIEPYRDLRTEKTPRYIDQMPLLISGKNLDNEVVDIQRTPIQVADVFERRVNSSKPDWMNNLFYTGDGIVVPMQGAYSDGRFKIRKNSESLRGVNPESKLIDGGLPIESYEAVQGTEFKRRDLILDRDMTKDEARENPILLELLNGDISFRDAVLDKIFSEGKKQFSYDTMMGMCLPSELKQSHERAWFVGGLYNRSGLNGRVYLQHGDRLVGKAPEVPNALSRYLSTIQTPV